MASRWPHRSEDTATLTNDKSTEIDTKALEEREALIDCVRRLGTSATDAILDPATRIFCLPGIDGLIGYQVEYSRAVVYGDPLCQPADRPVLLHAFHHHCEQQGLEIIYMAVSEDFASWAIDHTCKALVEFGVELYLDPHHDPRDHTGVYGSLVRRKVRHAQKEGAAVLEYRSANTTLEREMEQVANSWIRERHGPQIHISNVRLFNDRQGKRWFYATKRKKVVGVVVLNQLAAHQGWLLNHLMHTSEAPNGTPELLVITALETLAKEKCHLVTFGTAVTPKLGSIIGFSSYTASLARILFLLITRLFRLQGRHTFWKKFHPHTKPLFVLFSKARIHWRDIGALMKALHVGDAKSGAPNTQNQNQEMHK